MLDVTFGVLLVLAVMILKKVCFSNSKFGMDEGMDLSLVDFDASMINIKFGMVEVMDFVMLVLTKVRIIIKLV